MAAELTALDPKELVLILIALVGIVPVLLLRSSQSKWFMGGYLLLCAGALATNLEALALSGLFNVVEHGAGIAASGIVFFIAARKRSQVLAEGEE
ncbi:hypothetical protein NDI76_00150 [Halogeometricum sp. S1BR25-6]|uniref:DUF2198 family protein n=1 Tax=Halogeometricum salsisoli TaxID=2950536 RepID=A0ABU2G8M0_9EURY|nr:hypothetical protein [Halogeometricum sp. S1BR25-6]MDS0297150.1 hypothetical protein [Halogeometricum sp. S1BR25-6]